MTLRTAAWAIDGVDQEAEDFRNLLVSLLGGVPGADWSGGISVGDGAHGVVHPAGLLVTEKDGTPDKSVNVAPGACFVRGTENADQGAYAPYNDDDVNLPIAEPDGANPRRDLVVVMVEDQEYGIAVADGASLAIVTGTPGAIPVDPDVPDNALVLARINVDAAATSITDSDIDDLRTFCALPILRCTEANLPATPYKGQRCHLTDKGHDVIYYGATTGWAQLWGTAWGAPKVLQTKTTSQTGITGTTTILTGTYDYVNGRKYEIASNTHPYITATNNGRVFHRLSIDGSTVGDQWATIPTALSTPSSASLVWTYDAPDTETKTTLLAYIAEGNTVANFGDSTHISKLWVKDIGPTVATPPSD